MCASPQLQPPTMSRADSDLRSIFNPGPATRPKHPSAHYQPLETCPQFKVARQPRAQSISQSQSLSQSQSDMELDPWYRDDSDPFAETQPAPSQLTLTSPTTIASPQPREFDVKSQSGAESETASALPSEYAPESQSEPRTEPAPRPYQPEPRSYKPGFQYTPAIADEFVPLSEPSAIQLPGLVPARRPIVLVHMTTLPYYFPTAAVVAQRQRQFPLPFQVILIEPDTAPQRKPNQPPRQRCSTAESGTAECPRSVSFSRTSDLSPRARSLSSACRWTASGRPFANS